MVWHEHAWVPAGHVLRCGDPDCLAWLPLPRSDMEDEPVRRPPRKPKQPSRPRPDVEAAGGVVVELHTRRR